MFIFEWLASFAVKEWLTEGGLYVVAIALIAGGFYLAFGLAPADGTLLSRLLKPIRWAGFGLMFAGLLLIGFTFGRSQGAASCEAAWKAKNYEARIAQLEQERDAKSAAAKSAEDALNELRGKSDEDQGKIADYEQSIGNMAASLRSCRAATDDDDRRLCDVTRGSAAGCKHP